MSFPFLEGLPGNNLLKGSKPVAHGVEPGGLDPCRSRRASRLQGVPAVRFGLDLGRHGTPPNRMIVQALPYKVCPQSRIGLVGWKDRAGRMPGTIPPLL